MDCVYICACVLYLCFLSSLCAAVCLLVHLLACLLSKEQESKGKCECGRDGRGYGMNWERGKHDQNILSDILN